MKIFFCFLWVTSTQSLIIFDIPQINIIDPTQTVSYNILPHTDSYAARTLNWTNLNINSTGKPYAIVTPGSTVNVSSNLTYTHTNGYCPGCIVQFYLRVQDVHNTCLRSGGTYGGGNVTKNFSFTAPSDPGTYYIQSRGSLQYSCINSNNAGGNSFGNNSIGVIVVANTGSNEASYTTFEGQ